jgi:hypothetical protein
VAPTTATFIFVSPQFLFFLFAMQKGFMINNLWLPAFYFLLNIVQPVLSVVEASHFSTLCSLLNFKNQPSHLLNSNNKKTFLF